MTSATTQGWTQLFTSSRPKSKKQCPKLFYNFRSSSKDGVSLYLTDLISLWRCSLSRLDIIATAGEQHTSIDPSESTEQMSVFLEKLASSLQRGMNKLVKQKIDDAENKELVLKTSVDLPSPLKQLEWTFVLTPQPASELAGQVLRPTLHQLSVSQQKLETMFSVVKDKDRVIERLLDRVAEKGVDMSLIFPTLTGTAKKSAGGVKVEDARRLVPGMTVFAKDTWAQQFGADEDNGMGLGLTELVQGCEKCFVHSKEEHEGWIERLPGPESLEQGPTLSRSQSQSQSQSQVKGGDDTDSENEFETQATPPGLSKKRESHTAEGTGSSAIEDEQPPTKRAETRKVGALGRRKQDTKLPTRKEQSLSPPPALNTSSPKRRRKSDESTTTETASSDSDSDHPKPTTQPASKASSLGGLRKRTSTQPSNSRSPPRSSSPPSQPPKASSNASLSSRHLGRIDKNRQRTATASPIPENETDGEKQSRPGTPSRRLGRLGLRNKTRDASRDVSEERPSPSTRTREKASPDVIAPGGNKRVTAEHDLDATSSVSPSPPPPPAPLKSSASTSKPASKDPTPAPAREKKGDRAKQSEKTADQEPETEDQKANRRREELKRTIQTGGGAKKKRRF